jgi:hypothetical protein
MQHLHAPVQQREQCQDHRAHVQTRARACTRNARTIDESDEKIMNICAQNCKMAPGSAVLCLVVAVWAAPAAPAADPPALANQFSWVGDLYNVQEVSSTAC